MKFVKYFFIFVFCCIFFGVISICSIYKYVERSLPDVATLKDVRLQLPMQIFSADNKLIAQYGEKRRVFLFLTEIPSLMIKAFIATEDSRFYNHYGIDLIGIFRALTMIASSGYPSQGASTITQQLARNFYLTPEKTFLRKMKEIFLAIRIEQLFTKNEIIELYLNKIYLGNRAYGVGAAAYVYFGKKVNDLSLNEIAMIAGLPKAPSIFNPFYSYKNAINRRNIVLLRMLEEGYITYDEYNKVKSEKIKTYYHNPKIDFSAPYLAEMVRKTLYDKYGENAYTDGYKVYTTLISNHQLAATFSLRKNLIDYDLRHGYRNSNKMLWKHGEIAWKTEKIIEKLKKIPIYTPLKPAVVISITKNKANILLPDGVKKEINITGIRWARKFISENKQGVLPKLIKTVIQEGEQIWVREVNNEFWLAQIPEVNAAFVSLNPNDGAITSLVGGFDFNISKFNRVTQSLRQVGSSIKPFLCAAAIEKGMTLSSLINDAPITRFDLNTGFDWKPKNSPPKYDGPMTLRQGLGQSKNVVMVRVIRNIGVEYAANYLIRFGFPSENINRTESLALGSSSFTPMQMVRAYSVIANGGYLIDPYYILMIKNYNNKIIFKANPKISCNNCTNIPVIYDKEYIKNVSIQSTILDNNVKQKKIYAPHVINTQLAFLIKNAMMTNIYGEKNWIGTAWRAAKVLNGRRDIGGKTGTTNNSKDAWFSGYGPDIVASAWIGFDNNKRTLGRTLINGSEVGANSAQPIWNDFMKIILNNIPVKNIVPPKGIISVLIDDKADKLGFSRKEYYINGTQPKDYNQGEIETEILIEDDISEEELF